MIAAQELVDCGQVIIDESDIVGEWQRPSFDIARSTIGVFDGDQLVAYGEISWAGRGDAAVHPDYAGRKISVADFAWKPDGTAIAGYSGGKVLFESETDPPKIMLVELRPLR